MRRGYYCLLLLNERNKGRSFQESLSMFSDNVLANKAVVKDYFYEEYRMEVYCVKERRFTQNVPESETIAAAKNGRKFLKAKCAICGITKTRLIAELAKRGKNGNKKGGAISSRRGLQSQALKGVTDNVTFFKQQVNSNIGTHVVKRHVH